MSQVINHQARRDRVRELMTKQDLRSVVVTNPSNVRYLSGFTGSNGAVVVGTVGDMDRLATDFRYYTQAATQCPDLAVIPAASTVLEASSVWCAQELLAPIGFESHHVTVRQLSQLRDKVEATCLIPTYDVVESLRAHKDDAEREFIRQACAISDAALARLVTEIRVGQTERDIARRLSWLMLEEGADADSFESIVAGGEHSAIPHHTPTDRPLVAGDFLKIDFGALVAGYHADETRTFLVGAQPQAWQQEIFDLVALAQKAGIAALVPGADVRDVDAAARTVISEAGLGEHFGHGLGHGVGLDIHEVPFLGATSSGILSVGTPITVEPGVYLPGRGGVRIEDTLVVGLVEPVSLTCTTRELLVLGL